MNDASRPGNSDPAGRDRQAKSGARPLNVDRPGDALALVQHTFGHLPQDSLVVIGLSSGATGGHLRVDLAPVRDRPEALGGQCAEWIAGPTASPVPDAAMVLIFDSEVPHPDSPDQYDVLLQHLGEGLLDQAGASLVKVWHVGGGFIRDYQSCGIEESDFFPGKDAEAELRATVSRVPELVRTRARSPREALAEFLEPVPAVTGDQVSAVRDHRSPPPAGAEAVTALWEAALRRSIRGATADLRSDGSWIHAAPAQVSALVRTIEESQNIDVLMALTVTSVDAVDEMCSWVDPEDGLGLFAESIWGVSAATPKWERVDALTALLRHLMPYSLGEQRAEILGLRAWVEWIRGSGSTATVFAEEVRREYPDIWASSSAKPVARKVMECVRILGVCPWAKVKETSYSWWLGSR